MSTVIRSGSEALLVYPEGDVDTVTVVSLRSPAATGTVSGTVEVRLPSGELLTTVPEDIGIGVDDDLVAQWDDEPTPHDPRYPKPLACCGGFYAHRPTCKNHHSRTSPTDPRPTPAASAPTQPEQPTATQTGDAAMSTETQTAPSAEDVIERGSRRFADRAEIEAAGFVPGWHGAPAEVGELAVVHGHGQWRQGIVTKVTRTKVHVVFTTPGAIAEAERTVQAALTTDADKQAALVRKQELSNWDYFARVADAPSSYDTTERTALYRRYVEEGREAYADRKAAEVAESIRNSAQFAAEHGRAGYLNLTKGTGDRTPDRTNLYVQPR